MTSQRRPVADPAWRYRLSDLAKADIQEAGFDGVTAGLRVNESVHAPLLCVVDVFDVASGDLSLPGRVKK